MKNCYWILLRINKKQGCQQTIKYLSSNRLVKVDTPSLNCLQVFKPPNSNLGCKCMDFIGKYSKVKRPSSVNPYRSSKHLY